MDEDKNINNTLMLEILKDIHRLTEDSKENRQGIMRIRDDIHGLRGDGLLASRGVSLKYSRIYNYLDTMCHPRQGKQSWPLFGDLTQECGKATRDSGSRHFPLAC